MPSPFRVWPEELSADAAAPGPRSRAHLRRRPVASDHAEDPGRARRRVRATFFLIGKPGIATSGPVATDRFGRTHDRPSLMVASEPDCVTKPSEAVEPIDSGIEARWRCTGSLPHSIDAVLPLSRLRVDAGDDRPVAVARHRVRRCAGHAQQLGSESLLPNLMEVKG